MSKTTQICSVFLVFLWGVFGLQAQTKVLKGTVMDHQSKIGIEGVMVSTAEGNSYTITNSEGDFVISIDEQVESLWFSQINYLVKEVSTKAAMLIELELISKELEEILVFTRPLNTVFGPALERATKSLTKGDLYQTYVRAFNLVNNDLSNVADGLVDFYIERPNRRPIIEIKQNRVLMSKEDVSDESETEELFGVVDMKDMSKLIVNTDNITNIQSILKNEKNYDYVVKKREGALGEETCVVEFSPKENLKGWKYYEGYAVFTADQQHLIGYNYGLSKSYEKNRRAVPLIYVKMFLNDLGYQALYRKQADEYQLSYLSIRTDLDVISTKIGNHRVVSLREVVVDTIIKDAPTLTSIAKKRNSLFTISSNYQTEFWKNRNIRLLTSREQKALENLEEEFK